MGCMPPIEQVAIDLFRGHRVGQAPELPPSLRHIFDTDVHQDLPAPVRCEQGPPRPGGNAHRVCVTRNLQRPARIRMEPDKVLLSRLENLKAQRSDVGRDDEARVIRADVRLPGDLGALLRRSRRSRPQAQPRQDENNAPAPASARAPPMCHLPLTNLHHVICIDSILTRRQFHRTGIPPGGQAFCT